MGEKGFREMTSSAEEVIDIYPNMFNFCKEFGCHCDISEAHQILWSLGILDEEFQFHEPVISSSRVPSLQGQDDLMTVLCGIYDAKETRGATTPVEDTSLPQVVEMITIELWIRMASEKNSVATGMGCSMFSSHLRES